jgi:hypothetical protein
VGEQPDFISFKCPRCGFDAVQRTDYSRSTSCPECAWDWGHDVAMKGRVCLESDKPESCDGRLGTQEEKKAARAKVVVTGDGGNRASHYS